MMVPFSHLTLLPVVGRLVSVDGSCGGRRECLPRHGVVGVPSPLTTVEAAAERLLFSCCPFVRSLCAWLGFPFCWCPSHHIGYTGPSW